MAKRCGEADGDVAIITTVVLVDDRDVSIEHSVFFYWYNQVHLYSDRPLCRSEVLTRCWFERPCSPCQGVVDRPVQQGVGFPDIFDLETSMDRCPWFDVRPGESPVAFEVRDRFWWGWWRRLIRWYVLGAVHLVVIPRVRVDVLPDDFFVWGDFDEHPIPSGADEGVVVHHPLGTAEAIRKKLTGQLVLPGEVIWAVGSPWWEIVFTGVVVDIRGDLIDAGNLASWTGVTVGENQDVARMGETLFDPAALMLEVEFFITGCSSVVGLGVTPAVEQIATVTVLSTLVACCFLGSSTVVDDPDLIEVMGAEEDLVELGVVIHGVHIRPAWAPVLVEVDVGEFRMLADDTVIIL